MNHVYRRANIIYKNLPIIVFKLDTIYKKNFLKTTGYNKIIEVCGKYLKINADTGK